MGGGGLGESDGKESGISCILPYPTPLISLYIYPNLTLLLSPSFSHTFLSLISITPSYSLSSPPLMYIFL